MRAEISSGKYIKRHPLDWYVEECWVTDQLAQVIGFAEEREAGEAIWDPCAGYGHTGQAMENRGFRGRIFLSDLVENVEYDAFAVRPTFFQADFLTVEQAPAPCTIIANPPYSYIPNIAESFVRHALKLATRRVCMVLPAKWLATQQRYKLFAEDHPPHTILHLSQRPSMPPGDRITEMGTRAYSGGMVDYCWLIWDVQNPTEPGDTRTIWAPPLGYLSMPRLKTIANRQRGLGGRA